MPAAATIPAWRMPPPSSLRYRSARTISSAVPAIIDPTGAPRPFERQNWTVSTSRQMTSAPTPSATAALNRRAPSMCTFMPRACA